MVRGSEQLSRNPTSMGRDNPVRCMSAMTIQEYSAHDCYRLPPPMNSFSSLETGNPNVAQKPWTFEQQDLGRTWNWTPVTRRDPRAVLGRDTFGNYRTVTKWPVVPPRTAPPYLPPPGTAKAYELEEKRLKSAKALALRANGSQSPGMARPKTCASSTRTQPDMLRMQAAKRATTPDGEKRVKTPDDARKPPSPERRGSARRLSTAGSTDTHVTGDSDGEPVNRVGSFRRVKRANSIWTMAELCQNAPEIMHDRLTEIPLALKDKKWMRFHKHIRTEEEARALIMKKLERNPQVRQTIRQNEPYFEYTRRVRVPVDGGEAGLNQTQKSYVTTEASGGWNVANKSYMRGKHVVDPNSSWVPTFLAMF